MPREHLTNEKMAGPRRKVLPRDKELATKIPWAISSARGEGFSSGREKLQQNECPQGMRFTE
jgi:hypothetical protein